MLTSPQAIAWTMVAALTGALAGLSEPALAASTSPDPTDARAPVPPLVYQSPLASVRRLSDAPLRAWRQEGKPMSPQADQGHDHTHHHADGHATPAPQAASDPHAGHSAK